MNTLPSLFVSHGSPMIALEPGATGAFLHRLGETIDARFGRPRAILAASAHTLARTPVLFGAARHEAVHDFGGFPATLYTLRYDAPGAPEVAAQAAELLQGAGIEVPVIEHAGLDHGIWTALRHVYAQADVPVVPLAWSPNDAPERLFALGRALAPLRAQGVLLLGTGSITHNLRRLFGGVHGRPSADAPEIAESAAFRAWFAQHARERDWPALFDYRAQAPHAVDMHPTDEHLLPWFVAAGAGGPEAAPVRLHDEVTFGALGMDAYAFGPEAAALMSALATH